MLVPSLLLVTVDDTCHATEETRCLGPAAQSSSFFLSLIFFHAPTLTLLITLLYLAHQYTTWRASRIRLQQLHKQKIGMNTQGWVVGGAYIPKSEERKRLERFEALEQEERQQLLNQQRIPLWGRNLIRAVSGGNGESAATTAAVRSSSSSQADNTSQSLKRQSSLEVHNEAQQLTDVISSTTLPHAHEVPLPMDIIDDDTTTKSVNRRLSFSSALKSKNKKRKEHDDEEERTKRKKNAVRFSEALHSTRYYTREGAPSSDMMIVDDSEEKKEETPVAVAPRPSTYDAAIMSESKENIANMGTTSRVNNVNVVDAVPEATRKPVFPAPSTSVNQTVTAKPSATTAMVPAQPRFGLGSYTTMPSQRLTPPRLPSSTRLGQSRKNACGRIQLPSHFLQGRRTAGRMLHVDRTHQSRQQRIWEERVVLGALNAKTPRQKTVTFAPPASEDTKDGLDLFAGQQVAAGTAAVTAETGEKKKVTFSFRPAATGDSTAAPASSFILSAAPSVYASSSTTAAPAASAKTVGFTFGAPATSTVSDTTDKVNVPVEDGKKRVEFSFGTKPPMSTTGPSSTTGGAPSLSFGSTTTTSVAALAPAAGVASVSGGFTFGSTTTAPASGTTSAVSTSAPTAVSGFAFGSATGVTTPSIPPTFSFEATTPAPASPGFAFGGDPSTAGFTPHASVGGFMNAGAGSTPGFALGGAASARRRAARTRKR